MYSSKFLQLSKAILVLVVGAVVGCQKGKFVSQTYGHDQSGIVREPIITPFTDFPDSDIPVLADDEEEAPPVEEGPKPKAPETPAVENENPESAPTDTSWVPEGLTPEDFSTGSKMSPTIYYHPVIKDSADRCKPEERVDMLTIDDKVLIKVCKVDFAKCTIQGTCTFVDGETRRSFNHHSTKGGVDRYFEMKQTGCIYGYGVTNICLDPFYSVAADLTIYRPGTVIYVPSAKGLALPNGHIHDGFFVVRDRGGGVKGAQRFDFFTGSFSWISEKNPFAQARLGDPQRKQKFFILKSEAARAHTLKTRNFPAVPK